MIQCERLLGSNTFTAKHSFSQFVLQQRYNCHNLADSLCTARINKIK